jgi:hypothetical protein
MRSTILPQAQRIVVDSGGSPGTKQRGCEYLDGSECSKIMLPPLVVTMSLPVRRLPSTCAMDLSMPTDTEAAAGVAAGATSTAKTAIVTSHTGHTICIEWHRFMPIMA